MFKEHFRNVTLKMASFMCKAMLLATRIKGLVIKAKTGLYSGEYKG